MCAHGLPPLDSAGWVVGVGFGMPLMTRLDYVWLCYQGILWVAQAVAEVVVCGQVLPEIAVGAGPVAGVG